MWLRGADARIDIVSSQFDADRLDYMRRDRMMAGTQEACIDFTWLLANLEVNKIEVGSDEQKFDEVMTFVLGPKALWAGESYVLSLFQLYPAVYLHKTTRGAEKIFSNLLSGVKEAVDEGRPGESGLPACHPLLTYLKDRTLASYLELDDSLIWGGLPMMAQSRNPQVREAAERLRRRDLFKAVDVRAILGAGRVSAGGGADQRVLKFRRLLGERFKADQSLVNRILIDQYERSPYKRKSYDTPKAIERIHILIEGRPTDLADVSDVVKALMPFPLLRVYIAPEDKMAANTVKEVLEEARK